MGSTVRDQILLLAMVLVPVAGSVYPEPAQSRTWHVVQNGQGDAPTIQAGIDSASHGDIVLVGAGRYFENIVFKGKALEVRSESGPGATIIDGSSAELSCVRIVNGEGHGTTLSGFTLTGGRGVWSNVPAGFNGGGGILIFESEPTISGNIITANRVVRTQPFGNLTGFGGGVAIRANTPFGTWSPTIINNVIENNTAGSEGGGIFVRGHFSPVIVGNTIRANEGTEANGGGLYLCLWRGNATVVDNVIIDNHTDGTGGGLVICQDRAEEVPVSSTVSGNIIARNSAHNGGGVWLNNTAAWFHHNTIVANRSDAGWGGGVFFDQDESLFELNIVAFNSGRGGIICGPGTVRFISNISWANVGDSTSELCLQVFSENGNLAADPLFCDLDGGDYSVAENSPASRVLTYEVIGAIRSPMCPARTPVFTTTWGHVKSLFPVASGP